MEFKINYYKKTLNFFFIIGLTIIIFSLCGIGNTHNYIYSETSKSKFGSQNQSLIYKEDVLNLLSTIVEHKIIEATKLLLVTSQNPEIKNVSFSDLINENDHGIPENTDITKKDIAEMIINLDSDFGAVYFVMLNGDIYMGEPFSIQKQLDRLNYADREWYKGISSKDNKTNYVSGVFISSSLHKPSTSIVVPVHDKEKNEILGYWVGILNLHDFKNILNNLSLNKNEYISIFDHNGTIIADSKNDLLTFKNNTQTNQFDDLDIVKQMHDEKKGKKIENFNNSSKLIIYQPIDIGSHYWGVVYINTDVLK